MGDGGSGDGVASRGEAAEKIGQRQPPRGAAREADHSVVKLDESVVKLDESTDRRRCGRDLRRCRRDWGHARRHPAHPRRSERHMRRCSRRGTSTSDVWPWKSGRATVRRRRAAPAGARVRCDPTATPTILALLSGRRRWRVARCLPSRGSFEARSCREGRPSPRGTPSRLDPGWHNLTHPLPPRVPTNSVNLSMAPFLLWTSGYEQA
jgi:hypothetical protein